MRKISSFIYLSVCILMLLTPSLNAQRTLIHKNPDAIFQTAQDLFDKERYGSAREHFEKVIAQTDEESQLYINASYYAAICALELFNESAEYEVLRFVKYHPGNALNASVIFKLGNYQYNKKAYAKALKMYELVSKDDLSMTDLHEYYFKKGYSYFKTEKHELAEKTFFEIKNTKGDFSIPATYYYGHCAYMNKNYQTALQCFEQLTTDSTFKEIVPYYITQIYYLQGKYDKLLQIAVPLFDVAVARRAPEIARFIADAYFKTGKYKDAVPYLEMYKKSGLPFSSKDAYELGYCYYVTKDFEHALENLQTIPFQYDSISQNAYYHSGNAYLQLNRKPEAMNAFMLANSDYDKEIQEDALFKYGQLAYELNFNQQNEAINAFNKYLEYYPKSQRIDEVNGYLVDLFLTSKNYSSALEAIEKIKNKDYRLESAYQKIAYFRAIEYFNNGDFTNAIALFDKSLSKQLNKPITAQAMFWKAEALYRLEKYEQAIGVYNSFLTQAGSYVLPNYRDAHYNSGYAAFKMKKYAEASTSLRKYIGSPNADNEPIPYYDAHTRIGDCFFIQKDYKRAIEFYEKVSAAKAQDADYAYYQTSLCFGVLGNYNKKIETLLGLMKEFPQSTYDDDAKYELANICFAIGDYERAGRYYKLVVDEYPSSGYVQKSQLQMGLINYNTQNYTTALDVLKNVVNLYPATAASKEALVTIKNVYMQMDRVEEFFVYVKGLSFVNISSAEQDSISYMAVEQRYLEGDCDKSITGFGNYIEKFPAGYFIVNAHFYKGECELKNNNTGIALQHFEAVLTKPRSTFTETAMLKAATICKNNNDYAKAITYFAKLEETGEFKKNILLARTEMMRCYEKSNQPKNTIDVATRLLNTEKISNETKQEAYLSMAKANLAMNEITKAQSDFTTAMQTLSNETAAEARYNLANIAFIQKQYSESEKLILELINQVPGYEYWIAKGFILWSDIYMQTDNAFQAKYTLKSVIDNYEGADLVQEAQKKLDIIIEKENLEQQKRLAEEARIKEEQLQKEKEQAAIEEKQMLQGVDMQLKDNTNDVNQPAQ